MGLKSYFLFKEKTDNPINEEANKIREKVGNKLPAVGIPELVLGLLVRMVGVKVTVGILVGTIVGVGVVFKVEVGVGVMVGVGVVADDEAE